MNSTKIEWCDITINPIVGCSKCSPGCDNCYAERIAAMRVKHPNPKISGKYAGTVDSAGKWTGVTDFDVSCLVNLPKTSKRIFVGSMGDLFHDSVMDSHLEHVMGHIGLTRSNAHHTFMLLTKRPERMREFFTHWKPYREVTNVWLGVTVCNQAEADAKIPVLLDTPAAKRFVSVEPMLGPLDLGFRRAPTDRDYRGWNGDGPIDYVETARVDELHWVICGGETGPGARPIHPDWARSLRDQCTEVGVPFFFKSFGAWRMTYDKDHSTFPIPRVCSDERWLNLAGGHGFHGERVVLVRRVGKKLAIRHIDGREWNEVPA